MSAFTLSSAVDYFSPIHHPDAPPHAALLAMAEPPPPPPKNPESVFNSSDSGLISIILGQSTVPEAVQKALDVQRQNLIDLTGVASAYVRKTADQKKDPNVVYDTMLWQNVFNHLPLMGPSRFLRQTFDQQIQGVEVATRFITTILGVATAGGAALASFAQFLSGLGDSVRAGIESGSKEYHVGSIAIVLEGQQVGNEIKINPWLKGYFIDFKQEQKRIYSSCASYESFRMTFDYRSATSLFNYGALDNPTIKKQYDTFIAGTQADDIKSASNFFSGTFDTK